MQIVLSPKMEVVDLGKHGESVYSVAAAFQGADHILLSVDGNSAT
jgi:hypothetical protein